MIAASLLAVLAGLGLQEPPADVTASPAQRTEAQAALDVCLFTPALSRDPACTPLLQAESALVPSTAFMVGDSMAWADQACVEGQVPAGQTRSDCRREQRALYRRAERAMQALHAGEAGGVYAEALSAPPPPASGVAEPQGLAFSESRRRIGDNCEQSSSARQDTDSGSSSSSASFTCTFGSDDEASRENLRRVRERLMSDE